MMKKLAITGTKGVIELVPSRRVLSERMFRLKVRSERKFLLLTKMLGSLIAD